MAGSRQVTRLEAKSYVPDRLWFCPPSAAKPVIESKYNLRPGPADLHLLVESWSLQGIAYIYVWLEALMTPQNATLDSLRTLSWFVSYRRLSSQFQFSVSAVTLGYLSRWCEPRWNAENISLMLHDWLAFGCQRLKAWRKVERQVKVLIKNLAIFFLCPSKQFLPILFQIQLLEYFPRKQKEQRHKQLGHTDKLVTTQI